MPAGKGKTSISTVLPEDIRERLQKIADRYRWSLSQAVRESLIEFIDDIEQHYEQLPAPGVKGELTQVTRQRERKTKE